LASSLYLRWPCSIASCLIKVILSRLSSSHTNLPHIAGLSFTRLNTTAPFPTLALHCSSSTGAKRWASNKYGGKLTLM
uniref:Uncharacterized protein n=1 Tax=Amphimedon queenslandica TaxID=400682 RepID=A0A1X7V944_AMPQE